MATGPGGTKYGKRLERLERQIDEALQESGHTTWANGEIAISIPCARVIGLTLGDWRLLRERYKDVGWTTAIWVARDTEVGPYLKFATSSCDGR